MWKIILGTSQGVNNSLCKSRSNGTPAQPTVLCRFQTHRAQVLPSPKPLHELCQLSLVNHETCESVSRSLPPPPSSNPLPSLPWIWHDLHGSQSELCGIIKHPQIASQHHPVATQTQAMALLCLRRSDGSLLQWKETQVHYLALGARPV